MKELQGKLRDVRLDADRRDKERLSYILTLKSEKQSLEFEYKEASTLAKGLTHDVERYMNRSDRLQKLHEKDHQRIDKLIWKTDAMLDTLTAVDKQFAKENYHGPEVAMIHSLFETLANPPGSPTRIPIGWTNYPSKMESIDDAGRLPSSVEVEVVSVPTGAEQLPFGKFDGRRRAFDRNVEQELVALSGCKTKNVRIESLSTIHPEKEPNVEPQPRAETSSDDGEIRNLSTVDHGSAVDSAGQVGGGDERYIDPS